MLVSFFQSVTPLLSPTPGSSIIVTLFEGEPYTLWNIRDLARHSGLEVQRSFRFQAGAYPGYRHARTLGVVRTKGKEGEISESAWRGEERESRSFVFVRKGEGEMGGDGGGRGKRKRGVESDDESDQDDGEGVDYISDIEAGDYNDDHAEDEDKERIMSENESRSESSR